MENLEAIYDAHIAPLMDQINAICQQHQIPMFATFQFSNEQFGTAVQPNKGHAVFAHLPVLLQCAEPTGINVDKFIMWLMRRYQGQPHSSLCLHQLGLSAEGATEG
jgi:hypothetical protein